MHALFSRRFLVVVASSSLMTTTKKLAFTHWSHLLPPRLASSSSLLSQSDTKAHGFFSDTLRNIHLKLKSGNNLLEARAGFFDPQLPPKPWVFTGFQKRGWKSWFNGAKGAIFGLIIANAAVFTLWNVSDRQWMFRNFVLSSDTFMTGRIHTLITSGFSNVGTSQLIMNMFGVYYFGSSIAKALGPVYLLKLYFAGSLAASLLFISVHGVMAILKSQGVSNMDQSSVSTFMGSEGSVYAITLLDLCLYPKVTTYFAFICRVPIMLGILFAGNEFLMVLDGEQKSISITGGSIHAVGGAMVAATAWRQIKKGRFNY